MSAALAIALFALSHGGAAKWNCSVFEQVDSNVSAYLETLVDEPGPLKRHVDFYVSWAQQPGYMAEQQLSWVGIPQDAVRLWKPDRYYFGISSETTDRDGFIVFKGPGHERVSAPSELMVRSLRPHFPITAVSAHEGWLVWRLWSGDGWTAEMFDSKGKSLGQSAILLPPATVLQPLFARMRAELDRKAASPQGVCYAIPEPTQQELEDALIHRGTPIRGPDLEAVEPVTKVPKR